jgi:hypothetical protein
MMKTLLIALLVAGCNGLAALPSATRPTSGAPAASAVASTGIGGASIDSCAVLSDTDIFAATGEKVLSRKASTLTQVFPSVCDIELDNGGSLTVSVKASGGKQLYDESFEPFIGEENAPLDEAIIGLGDKAARGGQDTIMALKGDVLFEILYIEFGRSDKLPVVHYLAEIILAKLPCVATGCPGFTPPPPPATPQAVDVCALLTNDEVAKATGYPVVDRKPSTSGDAGCTWTLNTGSDIPGLQYVELALMPSGGRTQFDFNAGAYDPPLGHIAGLGDDALKTATIPDGKIYVVMGDRLLTATFSMPLSVDDPYALVVPLVKTAVSRL